MPLDDSPGSAHYESQGASLLSKVPLTSPMEMLDRRAPPWWGDLYLHAERRMATLRNWRWTWWYQWYDLAEFFLPRRMRPWIVANNYNRGRYLNTSIIDSTGSLAALTCASGMWSGLTNPARPWFGFDVAIPNYKLDTAADEFLLDLKNRVAAVLHQSNFYSAMAQFFQDVVVFGTAPLICYEDDEDVIRFYNPCCGEYFLGAGARLTANTLYREFTWTVLQCVEMFGLDNCPQQIRNFWAQGGGNLDNEVIIAHAIEPNFAVGTKQRNKRWDILPAYFTYREVYWVRGMKTDRPLSIRGFRECPFVVGRWTLVSNDVYGRGPGMDALGDQKQIQQQTRRKAEFIEKGIRPPMIADPDMKNEPASIMPGMVTFVNTANNKKGFVPAFEVNAVWLQHLVVDMKDVSARIDKCFYVPNFMAITQMAGVQPRNELELTKRDLERLQILGPVIDLFENEAAGPIIQRVVGIMQRRGMVKPMPPSLQGVPLKISYMSLARMAQTAAEAVGLKDFAASIGTASLAAKNAGVPDPARKVNWDRWTDHYADATHVPGDIVFSDDEVALHDKARADAEERARQQEQASSLAKPAVDAAKVLSQTPVDGGSVLNSILTGNTTSQ